jgi:uncharacterized membrane protein YcgQ (UPF0703/DUF1980 family)
MRKNKSAQNSLIIAAVMAAVSASFITVSCSGTKKTEAPNNGMVEINDKMFIAQVNDVYLNSADYLGKTIKLEGLFKKEQYSEGKDPYCFVIRYGPGCCGNDGNVGFEVAWAEGKATPYPSAESWVEAIGVLKYYEEDENSKYLYLDLNSLNVLNKQGMTTVFQ